MAEKHAGQGLDLDILQRGALDLGKIADLGLREFDVGDRLRRNFGDQRPDLVIRQPKARRRPFVEPFREFAHRAIAARPHIGDDRFDRAADLGIGLFLPALQRGGLDLSRHLPASRDCGSLALETKKLSPDTPGRALF